LRKPTGALRSKQREAPNNSEKADRCSHF